jgi:hypothetical protein
VFFLADVQAGVGTFLANFLLSSLHWNAGKIGVIMTIAGSRPWWLARRLAP